ncbi:MAG: tRNA pseudouridine(38-40) synthase TruA [Nitrospirae bacterium]|nr:tRNA pseudouridine(38-40) synthase TruA [Nitrospirota bacterium]
MKRLLLTIQYDGSAYHGWQIQNSVKTIQGVIEGVLSRITGEFVRIYGSGRTDAGVHALGQRAIFDTRSRLAARDFYKALNALLPEDIRIIDAVEVGMDFHPRFNALSKRYFYLIYNTSDINPFLLRYAWHIKYPIDLDIMKQSVVYFKGIHDFKSFTTNSTVTGSTVREIYDLTITIEKSLGFFGAVQNNVDFIKISVQADGFLRYMVRNIVGTLVDVSSGKINKAQRRQLRPQTSQSVNKKSINQIISAKDRCAAGIAAPPNGLYLERVFYEDSLMKL